MYEYVIGVKNDLEGSPRIHSPQLLSLKEAQILIEEWNADEVRRAKLEQRPITAYYVVLFRSTPPWQEALPQTLPSVPNLYSVARAEQQ